MTRRLIEIMPERSASDEDECNKFIDRIIKTNREIFILSSLQDKQMCGYEIIKDVFQRCNVFLSQGSVYPILYSLEEEGLLHVEYIRGDMRSKKYSLTPKGSESVQRDIEEFIEAIDHISALIRG
jgi:PadR family transcriptional regulator PadR